MSNLHRATHHGERPENPGQGDSYWDEDERELMIYDRGAWKSFVDDVVTYPTRRKGDGAQLYLSIGQGHWRACMVPVRIRYRKEGDE